MFEIIFGVFVFWTQVRMIFSITPYHAASRHKLIVALFVFRKRAKRAMIQRHAGGLNHVK